MSGISASIRQTLQGFQRFLSGSACGLYVDSERLLHGVTHISLTSENGLWQLYWYTIHITTYLTLLHVICVIVIHLILIAHFHDDIQLQAQLM